MQEAGSRSMRAVKVIECNVRASRTVLLLKVLPMLNFRLDLHTRGTFCVEDLQHQFHRAGHTCHAWPGERCNLLIAMVRLADVQWCRDERGFRTCEPQDIKPMKVHVNDFDFVACKASRTRGLITEQLQFRQPAMQYQICARPLCFPSCD